MILKGELPRSEGGQDATEKWRAITDSSRNNESTGPKQKRQSAMEVCSGESKVQYYTEQYCIHTWNVKVYNLDFEEAEESKFKLPTSVGSWRKQQNSIKYLFCFTDYAKAIDCVNHKKPGNFFKRWEYQTTLSAS